MNSNITVTKNNSFINSNLLQEPLLKGGILGTSSLILCTASILFSEYSYKLFINALFTGYNPEFQWQICKYRGIEYEPVKLKSWCVPFFDKFIHNHQDSTEYSEELNRARDSAAFELAASTTSIIRPLVSLTIIAVSSCIAYKTSQQHKLISLIFATNAFFISIQSLINCNAFDVGLDDHDYIQIEKSFGISISHQNKVISLIILLTAVPFFKRLISINL